MFEPLWVLPSLINPLNVYKYILTSLFKLYYKPFLCNTSYCNHHTFSMSLYHSTPMLICSEVCADVLIVRAVIPERPLILILLFGDGRDLKGTCHLSLSLSLSALIHTKW